MFNLFILLLERVGLIIIIAYMLMNINHFKTMMGEREKLRSQWQLTILFALFVITSNFTGIEIENGHIVSSNIYYQLNDDASMANTRVLTIGMSGLIGPFVAIIVGIVSGLSRLYIGVQMHTPISFHLFSSHLYQGFMVIVQCVAILTQPF